VTHTHTHTHTHTDGRTDRHMMTAYTAFIIVSRGKNEMIFQSAEMRAIRWMCGIGSVKTDILGPVDYLYTS